MAFEPSKPFSFLCWLTWYGSFFVWVPYEVPYVASLKKSLFRKEIHNFFICFGEPQTATCLHCDIAKWRGSNHNMLTIYTTTALFIVTSMRAKMLHARNPGQGVGPKLKYFCKYTVVPKQIHTQFCGLFVFENFVHFWSLVRKFNSIYIKGGLLCSRPNSISFKAIYLSLTKNQACCCLSIASWL